MFTQPCFIRKNTKELRDKLERLGYEYTYNGASEWLIPIESLHFLGVNLYSYGKYMGINGIWSRDWIDCETNDLLFLAICALRNDTDKYQWFVNKDGEFFKCFEREFSHFKFDEKLIAEIFNPIEKSDFPISDKKLEPIEDTKDWHKATVEELIEFFKDKQHE